MPTVEQREHLLSPFYAQLQDMNSSDWYKGVESNTKKKDAVPSELLAPYYEVCIFDEYDTRLRFYFDNLSYTHQMSKHFCIS